LAAKRPAGARIGPLSTKLSFGFSGCLGSFLISFFFYMSLESLQGRFRPFAAPCGLSAALGRPPKEPKAKINGAKGAGGRKGSGKRPAGPERGRNGTEKIEGPKAGRPRPAAQDRPRPGRSPGPSYAIMPP
jgi:hypothetical protein